MIFKYFQLFFAIAIGVLQLDCVFAGSSLEKGIGAYWATNYQQALNILEPLAIQNNSKAILFMAHIFTYTKDPSYFEPELGMEYYQRAANLGEPEAQYQMGKLILLQLGGGKLTAEYERNKWIHAFPFIDSAAKKGHVLAQLVLSNYYFLRLGLDDTEVEQKNAEAYMWGKAAEKQISNPGMKKLVSHWVADLKNYVRFSDYITTDLKAIASLLPKLAEWPSSDCPVKDCIDPNSIKGNTIEAYLKNN